LTNSDSLFGTQINEPKCGRIVPKVKW